ncbi:MAG: GntR family transcriptional regulator [Pirellulales bacterium]|nr:GntR family transcriptional regulator [Pirellulales bacterium]
MSSFKQHATDTIAARLRRLDLAGDSDARPKYERLRNLIAAEVNAGRLKPGEALPSEQHLAELFQIARTTVRQALAELEEDGLVHRRHGTGTFITDLAERNARVGLDVFALVVPSMTTGFWPALQKGFEAGAATMHRQILFCDTDNNLDKQGNVILQLVQKRVAGVAFAPTSTPATPAFQIEHLQQHGIPVVFCHRGVPGVKAPLLAIPFVEVGRKAGDLLTGQGHRRVAFFAMHAGTEAGGGYEAGLRQALEAAGASLPDDFIHAGATKSPDPSLQSESVLQALKAMLGRKDRPTAIFASFDPLAELIYLLLGQLGMRVPEEVSVVGVGGTWRHGAITSRLTSITIDEEAVGRRAADVLQEMNQGIRPFDDDERMPVPLGLAAGQTVGPAQR